MFWAELTGDEFVLARERAQGVCLVPLSCLERHGHHLPLGTDIFIARELCRRAAALEPVLVFPDFIFTQIHEARHCPGTIALASKLILRLLEEVCHEIARNGLSKIVLVSGHGGNHHLLRFFAQSQLARRRDYVVYVAEPPLLPEDAAVGAQWETKVDGHGGEIETSMILAIRPNLVARHRLPADAEGMPLERLKSLREMGIYTGIWWYADYPTHYCGDGRPATAEKGERFLAAQARALAAAIRLIKQDEETRRLQEEFFAAAEGLSPRKAGE
ncbi:MAG: creatininase family protein [Bacillota bacterium]